MSIDKASSEHIRCATSLKLLSAHVVYNPALYNLIPCHHFHGNASCNTAHIVHAIKKKKKKKNRKSALPVLYHPAMGLIMQQALRDVGEWNHID